MAEDRRMIWAEVERWYTYDFETDVTSIISKLTELNARYPGCRMDTQDEAYSDSKCFVIQVNRLENDEEYSKRLNNEATWKAQKAEHDRKEFERLSKLFGKTE